MNKIYKDVKKDLYCGVFYRKDGVFIFGCSVSENKEDFRHPLKINHECED